MARGCEPYCEIKGIGMGSSPTKPTAWPQNSDGIKKTLGSGAENAGEYNNRYPSRLCAANGDKILDAVEAEAYAEIFAGSDKKPLITSLKALLERVLRWRHQGLRSGAIYGKKYVTACGGAYKSPATRLHLSPEKKKN